MPPKKLPEPAVLSQADRIKQLRRWIGAAELNGHVAGDMVLHLTRGDVAALKRHPDVAVHEISFAMGEMRFMGVRIQEGVATTSTLELIAA